jgi:hypothetical protein
MVPLLIGHDLEGRPFTVDPSSLSKHCVVFGATGSGKTVLCKNIMEETSTRGIPILAIDPKGDIGCLGIRSLDFNFRPYSDVEAKLLGKSPEIYGKELEAEYRDKYNGLGHEEDDLKRFLEGTEVRIYTPRSRNGLPVSMSPKLTPPKDFAKLMAGEPSLALDLLELKASNLLRLAGYGEESTVQRSLITRILEEEWKMGHELTLEKLIELVTSPPFEKLGMLPLDDAIGHRDRMELSRRLNVLITDAGAKAWFIGEPPDFDRWFHKSRGRTPICVVDLRSIASEQGKQVFVEYLLQELFYWLTRQEGTQTLQYLLYFDEIHGYCPPVREPPSKKILMHLIHVSRAYGLGIVMATQNPVDVDYKVISNANFRFIGNLSTRQDIERVRTGLSLGSDAFQTISGLRNRQFYYQIFDQGQSGILVPRWLMSYHRGPLEPGEIKRLRERGSQERVGARVVPLMVPVELLLQEAEKKRAKKGLLGGAEETINFARVLYLPYLEFSYRYSAQKGLLSKQTVISEGKSAVLALREVDLGFQPELLQLAPQMNELELDPSSMVLGVDSTTLVNERLGELKKLLSDHDAELAGLSKQMEGHPKDSPTHQALKEHLENLRKTKTLRWKIFSDGLKLPPKIDLETFEFLEGNLFYIPYYVVKLSRVAESRYLVWDRSGKENDTMTDELMKNRKFRELIQAHAASQPKPQLDEESVA